MRTRITAEGRRHRMVDHYLDEGEVWAKYGVEQPSRHFAHREDWMHLCSVCTRVVPGLVKGPSIR